MGFRRFGRIDRVLVLVLALSATACEKESGFDWMPEGGGLSGAGADGSGSSNSGSSSHANLVIVTQTSPTPTGGPGPLPSASPSILPIEKVVSELFSPLDATSTTVMSFAPLDLLFVVDNSLSMDGYQSALLEEVTNFANSYLTADRDIRISVIPTDLYMSGRTPLRCTPKTPTPSNYIYPSSYSLLGSSLGFSEGADGPRPYFSGDKRPRTGTPVLTNQPPFGMSLTEWNQRLPSIFKLNAMLGSGGSGDERPIESVTTLLGANESRPTCRGVDIASDCLFRSKTIRGIIVISDEEDGSFGATVNAEPNYGNLARIDGAKGQIDTFFKTLDGSTDPRYFVMSLSNPSAYVPGVCSGTCGCASGTSHQYLVNRVRADVSNSLASKSKNLNIDSSSSFGDLLRGIGEVSTTYTETSLRQRFTLAQNPFRPEAVKVIAHMNNGALVPLDDFRLTVSGKVVSAKMPDGWGTIMQQVEIVYTVPK